VGSGAMVMASVVEGGVCWTRQVEMLFTGACCVSMWVYRRVGSKY
jgi:hypothetical protein